MIGNPAQRLEVQLLSEAWNLIHRVDRKVERRGRVGRPPVAELVRKAGVAGEGRVIVVQERSARSHGLVPRKGKSVGQAPRHVTAHVDLQRLVVRGSLELLLGDAGITGDASGAHARD